MIRVLQHISLIAGMACSMLVMGFVAPLRASYESLADELSEFGDFGENPMHSHYGQTIQSNFVAQPHEIAQGINAVTQQINASNKVIETIPAELNQIEQQSRAFVHRVTTEKQEIEKKAAQQIAEIQQQAEEKIRHAREEKTTAQQLELQRMQTTFEEKLTAATEKIDNQRESFERRLAVKDAEIRRLTTQEARLAQEKDGMLAHTERLKQQLKQERSRAQQQLQKEQEKNAILEVDNEALKGRILHYKEQLGRKPKKPSVPIQTIDWKNPSTTSDADSPSVYE